MCLALRGQLPLLHVLVAFQFCVDPVVIHCILTLTTIFDSVCAPLESASKSLSFESPYSRPWKFSRISNNYFKSWKLRLLGLNRAPINVPHSHPAVFHEKVWKILLFLAYLCCPCLALSASAVVHSCFVLAKVDFFGFFVWSLKRTKSGSWKSLKSPWSLSPETCMKLAGVLK